MAGEHRFVDLECAACHKQLSRVIHGAFQGGIIQCLDDQQPRKLSFLAATHRLISSGDRRGLGLAFAKELVALGASKVYAGVRNPEGVNTPGVIAIHLDVSDPASVAAAMAQAGDVTLLVNNAGIALVALHA